MKIDKIALGGDHAAFPLKEKIKHYLENKGIEVKDFGCYSEDSCDYPDIAHPLAQAIVNGDYDYGIVLCGSGNGINMTVNKYKKIRSALCWNADLAEMARLHNNANILALPARYIDNETAMDCVEKFISTDFEGGRHQRRVDKISENKHD